jgi:DNA-binding transcriptional LysR family regulator
MDRLARSNSGEALRQAAFDGLCLALLPAWMVGRDVAAGRLVACLPEHRANPADQHATIYAAHAHGPAVPTKTTAFVAHLRAALAPAEAD